MTTKQFNPATGEALSSVENTSESETVSAIEKCRAAQKEWAKRSFKERAACVYKVKAYLAENCHKGAQIISETSGKTRQDALATEILPCVMACDWYAKNTASVLKKQKLSCGNILFANKSNTLEYSPLGVVGIISPWNYPFSIPFGEVIMGLMAGNGIILKVATPTTLVGCFIEDCIRAGGFPEGLFAHVVVSGAKISTIMFQNGVNKIFFTGSVGVGKQLMKQAADTLTPLSLELGGKDPMVVMADADLDRAVNCAMWAGFQNAGQSCGGIERVYVHESIYDKFLEMIVTRTKALRHGADTGANLHKVDMGSVTTKGQLDTIASQVADAVKDGAKIVAQSQPVGDVTKGFFYPATVMVDVTHKMRLMTEETFGPVVPIMKFRSESEVVGLANDCTMALTSSVFSRNHAAARKLAAQLESGVVTINDHLYSHGMSEAPWGGWKESGLGRTHGVLGLKEMTNVKCINDDMVPSSWIPRNMWWYPFDKKSYDGLTNGIGFLAPKSVGSFFKASCNLVPFALGRMFKTWSPKKEDTVAAEESAKATAQ